VIMTERQRRWWFATHPEYSWSRLGTGTGSGSKYHRLFPKKAHELELELLWKAIEQDKKGLVPDPHTALDIWPYGRFITSPTQAIKDLFTSTARDVIINAVRRGKSEGPGKWVEVCRSPIGLEHQSKMSGQPIRESGGKLYINEYDLNGIKFDDYKNGILYEYKGRYGNLLKKDENFPAWAKARQEALDEAMRQTRAARGIPVIWRVGADQVNAFKEAVGDVPGITIVP
jgi:hypothetical protein